MRYVRRHIMVQCLNSDGTPITGGFSHFMERHVSSVLLNEEAPHNHINVLVFVASSFLFSEFYGLFSAFPVLRMNSKLLKP